MQNVLFVIPPLNPDIDPNDWRLFHESADARLKSHIRHVVRLGQTGWLVDNQSAPAALAWLIVTAESRKIPYAIASFDHAPVWLRAGFDPTAKPSPR